MYSNIISKIAHGSGEDLLTTTILMFKGRLKIFPAMHEEMYRIEYIANNTFLKVSSGEEVYPILDATIKTRTLEPGPS